MTELGESDDGRRAKGALSPCSLPPCSALSTLSLPPTPPVLSPPAFSLPFQTITFTHAVTDILLVSFMLLLTILTSLLFLLPSPSPLYSHLILPLNGQLSLLFSHRKLPLISTLIAVLQTVALWCVCATFFGPDGSPMNAKAWLVLVPALPILMGVHVVSGRTIDSLCIHRSGSVPLSTQVIPPLSLLSGLALLFCFDEEYVGIALLACLVIATPRGVAWSYMLVQCVSREHFVLTLGMQSFLGALALALAACLLGGFQWGTAVLPQRGYEYSIVCLGIMEWLLSIGSVVLYPAERLNIP